MTVRIGIDCPECGVEYTTYEASRSKDIVFNGQPAELQLYRCVASRSEECRGEGPTVLHVTETVYIGTKATPGVKSSYYKMEKGAWNCV